MNFKFFISFIILMLGIKAINEKLSCIGVIAFIGIVGIIIFLQLMFFKSELEKWICNTYFKDGSILKKICLSKIIYRIFALIFSFILSFSLLTFIYLADIYSLIFIFIDGLIIYSLYKILLKSVKNHLQDNLQKIFTEISINLVNIIIFIIISVIISYYTRVNIIPHINYIAHYTHEHIYHPCQYFKWYLRTTALFKYAIDSILNLNFIDSNIRIYLYLFFVATSISLLPAIALSFYYKFFLRITTKEK